MATLKEMRLFGLRNFGPHEEAAQTIEFSSPLTLFLGDNGCGKTTLIEAIKYVCSGNLPHGGGQAFIQDPRLNSMSSTKAEVQLHFSDAEGNIFLATTSAQIDNEGVKPNFGRISNTLQIANLCGTYHDIVGNVCGILRVSPAILDNVILCHQEDATWPFEEPKKLKMKFDDIFDVTKYNDCIDRIRVVHKNETTNSLKLKSKVDELEETKQIVDEKQNRVEQKLKEFALNEKIIKEKENEYALISIQLREIREMENDFRKLEKKHTEKQTLKNIVIKQHEYLSSNIKVKYAGSDQDLEKEISSFENNCGKIAEKCKALEEQKENEEVQKKQASTLIEKLQVRIGKLENEQQRNRNNISERNSLIDKLSKKLNVQVDRKFGTNDMVAEAISTISQTTETSKISFANLIAENDREEAQLQAEIDTYRESSFKTKLCIDSNNKEIKKIESKVRDIEDKLCELNSSDEQLKDLQTRIALIEEILKNLNSFDVNATSMSIESDKQKIRELEKELKIVERDYSDLQKNNSTEAELEVKKREIKKRESEMLRLKSAHIETFNIIFDDEIPKPGSIKNSIENKKQSNNNIIKDINKKITNKERSTTELQTKFRYENVKLESHKKKLQENEQQVFELCKDKSFDFISNELHRDIEGLQKNKEQYSSEKLTYEKFLRKFQSEKPCCPVCQTDFIDKQEKVNQIVDTIQNRIQSIPQELKKIEEHLKIKQEEYSKVLQLKPINDQIKELNTSLIPETQSTVDDLSILYEEEKKELASLREELITPQSIVDACIKLAGDSTLIDQYQHEIDESSKSIIRLELQLVQVPSNRSRQQAVDEIEALKQKLLVVRENREASEKKVQDHNNTYHKLQTERNQNFVKQLQIQESMQGKAQWQAQLPELIHKKETLDSGIKDLQKQLDDFEQKLKCAKDTQVIVKENNKKGGNKIQNELDQNEEMLGSIGKLHKFVKNYIKEDVDGHYKTTAEELLQCKNKVDSFEESISGINNKIIELNKQLAGQNAAFRELQDNLDLRLKRKEVETLTSEIACLEHQMINPTPGKEQELQKQVEEINKEINTCAGKNSVLEREIQECQADLNSPENAKVHTDYKSASIEYKCSVKLIEELELYLKSLELGVIEFHKERIAPINRVIRHLWSSIYRGNDCDYIEIKIDETPQKGSRRTYNYKVIQMKNDVELDMRGRCSAGQKVLACLIIRMALAEVLSAECGILALDEPTTSLDRANIVSLSEALARIINNQLSEKKFQLLIITHDEEFLSTLKSRVDSVSYFWRLSRNKDGNSVVNKEWF